MEYFYAAMIKSDGKYIYNVAKDFYKCSFLTFYSSKNLEKHVSQFLATFNIFNIEKN